MIDFEKEEFLQRLDIRVLMISALLESHEQILCKDLPRKDYIEMQKKISSFHREVMQQLYDLDKKTTQRFEFWAKEKS